MRARLLSSLEMIALLAGLLVASLTNAHGKDEWAGPAVLKDQKGTGWFLAFSPDGKTLAATSGGFDQQARRKLPNSLRLWDVEKEKLIRTLVADGPMIVGMAFTSDGKQLVMACYDGTFRRLDVPSGKEAARIKVGERMSTVSFSPDRKLVLLVNPKAIRGLLRIQNEYQIREVDTGKLIKPAKPFPTDPVLAIGPDAQSLVITVMQPPDPAVKLPPGVSPIGGPMVGHLWDAKTGQTSEALLKGTMTNAVFSPDGKRLLMTTLDLAAPPAGVQFWNVADKKLSAEKIALDQNFKLQLGFNRFAFADDSSLLAVAGDGSVRLFETMKMSEVAVLKDLTPTAEALQFAPDGKTLAAAQADGSIRLWRRKSE
jgi:WD40 repeat protein